jgi:hypothetical protein
MGWIAIAVLVGCKGVVGDPGAGPADRPIVPIERPPTECALDTGYDDLHRLSSDQMENTLRDLIPGPLGSELASLAPFPATRLESGFANDAVANRVDERTSHAIEDYAAAIGDHLLANASTALPAIMPCAGDPFSDASIDGCIDAFIDEFGTRAYRRPLRSTEHALARGLYDAVRPTGAVPAWAALMEFFVQSPAHLYRAEAAEGVVGPGSDVHVLSDYEVASRLSYFLWNTMPDETLFDAAKGGALARPDEVRAQAERLAGDERVLESIAAFHRDWLRIHRIDDFGSGDGFSESLRRSFLAESRELVRDVFLEGDGTFRTLLTTNRFPIDAELAAHYGVPAPATPWQAVEIPNRRGILTQASTMAAIGHVDGKNVTVMRAIYLLDAVLCVGLPPFPDNVDVAATLSTTSGAATARDRLAPTLASTQCNGCHAQINPHGYAFENYDALGRYRSSENGTTIDASGTLTAGDASGPFSSATDYVDIVASSETGQRCYVRQWFRFATGRRETAEDECAIDELADGFVASGGDVRSLMVALTTTDAFRTRRVTEE